MDDCIKRCKLKGYTISDMLTELQNTYSSPRCERYLNEFVGYCTEHW